MSSRVLELQQEHVTAARTGSVCLSVCGSVCPPGGEEGLLSLDQQYSVLLVPQSLQSLIHRAAGARSGDALVE